MALTFKDATFQEEVMSSDKLTIVDFWAEWCGPCIALGPTIDALHTEYEGSVNIGKLNVDENPETAGQFGVRSIPTIIFVKNGEVVDKLIGGQSKQAFVELIEKHK
ncbi:MAG: thioredoxin [Chitinophagales bacterium]